MDTQAVLVLLLIGVAVLVWRSFLPAYLGKKGENLATKEDIAAITNEVERVKSFYAKELKQLEHWHERLLEELRWKQQLRMAAVEKRLEVHQHAYMLWRKLRSKLYSDDINSIVLECQEWWRSNCLYLAPAAREAFRLAYSLAADHRNLVARGPASGVDAKENFEIIMKAGEAIVSGVELPTLGEREAEDATDKMTGPSQSDTR
jgi:hypothetical protein